MTRMVGQHKSEWWVNMFRILQFIRMPKHFKGITFYFNHWGVEKRGDGIDFSTPSKKVSKLKENNKFLFLYIAENAAYVFQKRMFSNTFEIEEFKSFIESKLT